MKVGDLIRYQSDFDDEVLIGIVATNPAPFEKYDDHDSVQVYWPDDCTYTWEEVEVVYSGIPKNSHLELISESR